MSDANVIECPACGVASAGLVTGARGDVTCGCGFRFIPERAGQPPPARSRSMSAPRHATVEVGPENTAPDGKWAPRNNASLDRLPRLPSYRYVELLGAGAHGLVARAIQIELSREVVIKFLRPELLANAQLRERLNREARVTARLQHPAIVRVIALEEEAGAVVYEYALGESLADRIRKTGRLPAPAALELAAQAASGLAAAHAEGVIHRDIKPENLLVDPDGTLKILDFGLASAAHVFASMTSAGSILGTPAYMAPEQARGHSVERTADLYSLGATLYEMLSGTPPFGGRTPMEVLESVLAGPPRSLALLDPELPETAVKIVERAMERKPAARYGDAQQMERALRTACLTLARPGARPAAERASRNRIRAASSADSIATAASRLPDPATSWPSARLAGMAVLLGTAGALFLFTGGHPPEGPAIPEGAPGATAASASKPVPQVAPALRAGPASVTPRVATERTARAEDTQFARGALGEHSRLPLLRREPSPRMEPAMAWDAARGELVLFGGKGVEAADLTDTWVRDSLGWGQAATTATPPVPGPMAYDSDRQRIVVSPGTWDTLDFCHLWDWTGVRWVSRPAATGPRPRYRHCVSYDSARHRLVLFGGRTQQDDVTSDTWESDGRRWAEIRPVIAPPARIYHALAYDPRRGRTVLFGGQGERGAALGTLGDTWEWDGTEWTGFDPATSPPPRRGHAMSYDGVAKKVMLFGGDGARNKGSDAWTWDGSNWSPSNAARRPPARRTAGLAYQASTGRVVLFGGEGAFFPILGDTWEWDRQTWRPLGVPAPSIRSR